MERAVILCEGPVIQDEHIGVLDRRSASVESDVFLTLAEMERQHIQRALAKTGGVLAGPQGAARLLGMRRSTVWSRMRKLGIQGVAGIDRNQVAAGISVLLLKYRHVRRFTVPPVTSRVNST